MSPQGLAVVMHLGSAGLSGGCHHTRCSFKVSGLLSLENPGQV